MPDTGIPDCADKVMSRCADDGGRCDHCPLDRLDAARCAEKGVVIQRALDLMRALKLAVQIGLDEIRTDEIGAMLIMPRSGICWRERSCLDRDHGVR